MFFYINLAKCLSTQIIKTPPPATTDDRGGVLCHYPLVEGVPQGRPDEPLLQPAELSEAGR